MVHELHTILVLAQRDLLKFLRDKGRIAATFVFPSIFLGVFGVTLDSGLGRQNLGFSYIDYVFSGILLQTIFQSSLSGIVSLIADREKDFAMSIFVAPVSRFSIVFGKILGESLVSMAQLLGIMLFGKLIGVSFSIPLLLSSLPIALLASIVGASFGILVASRIESEQNAQRIFPFLVFPMMFLSGAFTPVNNLPVYLDTLKTINPMYYGVDLMRNWLFAGTESYDAVVANPAWYDLTIFVIIGIVSFLLGTFLFTQKEGNR